VAGQGVGHDVGVVFIDLDIAPRGRAGARGQVAEVDSVDGVSDVYKSDAVAACHQGVFAPGGGVCPAPAIATFAAADLAEGEEGKQIDAVAGVGAVGFAVKAVSLPCVMSGRSGWAEAAKVSRLTVIARMMPMNIRRRCVCIETSLPCLRTSSRATVKRDSGTEFL
jgi:hypothetical protein